MKRGRLLKASFVTLMVCATAGTLFACGGDKEYKVVYLGGDGATGDAPATVSYKEGDKFTVANNTFTKADHTFKGWSDGTSTYLEGVEYTMGAADVTFTAQWEKNTTPEPTTEKYTVTYAVGDHAAASATAPAKVTDVAKNTQVTLPAAPAAAEGYEFTGWKVGSDTTLKKAGDKITVTANVTVTAQWKEKEVTPPPVDDKYATDAEIKDQILTWYTANSKYYYVADGEELTVQATITKDTPDAWTGIMADIALNNDFYRFRPDHWIWTNNLIHDAVGTPDAMIERLEPIWNDDTVNTYKALFADGASVIQVINVSLKNNVVTYTVTSYAGTDTELKTPVVTAVSKVTSKTDISEIQAYFYTDGGAVVSTASAKYAKASNTYVNLTFDFDIEGVEDAVVPMRPGKANYRFGVDPTKPGYTFGGWKSSDETDTKLYKDTDEVAVKEAVTYTAQWTQDEYTVTYAIGENAATGVTAPEGHTGKHYGDKITLPAAPAAAAGYEFDGWKVGTDTTLKAAETEIEVTGTVTITATFKAKAQYTATFNVGDHAAEGATVDSITKYYDDAEITLPAAPAAATGYKFDGWKVGDDTKNVGDKITLTANVTITAQWDAIEYTVSFDMGTNAAEGATVADIKAKYNTEITVPAGPAAETGYNFTGWKVGTSTTIVQKDAKLTITADTVLTAQWVSTENSWTVTFLANADDEEAHATVPVAKGAQLTLPTTNPTKAGHKFLGWYLSTDEEKTVLDTEALPNVTADVTYVAKWQAVFTVTVLDDLNGEAVEGAKTEYNGETPEALVIPTGVAKDGLTLAGWYEVVDGAYTGEALTAETQITKSMTIAAKWVITVTYALGENHAEGATAPEAVEVAKTVGKVTLPAAPAAAVDHAFLGWKVGDDTELKAADTEIDVTGHVTITAQYGYHVAIGTPDNEIGYTPNPVWTSTVHKGETVTLKGTMTSKAEANYHTVVMFIYGDSVWGNLRMDWFVNYTGQGDTTNITEEGWTITKTAGPDWGTFLASIANCDITITFDWSSPRAIRVTATVVSKAEGNATNTMSYTITPNGGAFAKQEYNIGLGGDHAYTVITEKTVAQRNDNPTVENPLVIESTGYAPIGYVTEINKGEKIEFTGKSTSTENLNWFSPFVTLFRGTSEKLPFRSDNFIVGSDPAETYTANLAAEGWASVDKSNVCSGTGDDFWTTMCALKNNGDLKVTVDWSGAKIVVTMAYTGKVGDVDHSYTQTYTVTLAEGNTDTSYQLALGGEKCIYTVTSIVVTPAPDRSMPVIGDWYVESTIAEKQDADDALVSVKLKEAYSGTNSAAIATTSYTADADHAYIAIKYSGTATLTGVCLSGTKDGENSAHNGWSVGAPGGWNAQATSAVGSDYSVLVLKIDGYYGASEHNVDTVTNIGFSITGAADATFTVYAIELLPDASHNFGTPAPVENAD